MRLHFPTVITRFHVSWLLLSLLLPGAEKFKLFLPTLVSALHCALYHYVDVVTPTSHSPQCPTQSCYSGSNEARQQHQHQHLLGASTQRDAERHHPGVQGKHLNSADWRRRKALLLGGNKIKLLTDKWAGKHVRQMKHCLLHTVNVESVETISAYVSFYQPCNLHVCKCRPQFADVHMQRSSTWCSCVCMEGVSQFIAVIVKYSYPWGPLVCLHWKAGFL